MVRWAFLFILCLVSSVLIYNDTVLAEEPNPSYVLADLRYEVYPTFSRLILASNEKIDFISYELEDPYRIVIDMIGVAYCELEEHADYRKGLVKSIEVVKNAYSQAPKNLDKFFYAVDYIIITPASKLPYTVSTTEGGKVIVVDIGEKELPRIKVSKAQPAEAASEESQHEEVKPDETVSASSESPAPIKQQTPEKKGISSAAPIITDENIIDYINFETLDESSLVIISSNKDIGFIVDKRYYPNLGIAVKPKRAVFTELQDEVRIGGGFVKLLRIVEDKTVRRSRALDKYYYPVKYIFIELAKDAAFDSYSNDDGTISIVEIFHSKPKKGKTKRLEEEKQPAKKTPAPTAVTERPPEEMEEEKGEEFVEEPEKEELLTKREIIKELREEIKREGLLKEETLAEAKKKEEGQREQAAAAISESIGREALKDLIVLGKGMLSLAEAQGVAIKNSPQAKTAKDEVTLTKMKKKEALRALLPQVKVKGSQTSGDVLTVKFIEEVYGVQGEQAVYQGRKLWNTYQQSKVNVKVADARYQKLQTDLDYKVAEAYYGVATALMNLKLQKDLLKEAEAILKIAQDRFSMGLSTNLEILNVKSQYNQIQFQIAGAERDLALARFKLQQAMNIDISKEKIDIGEVDTELQFKVLNVDMSKCLEMATQGQPDILVNKLLVESNAYGEKIAKGKDSFKVDVTGFYGRSDSYYSTESRNLQPDWNIGVKVSKPFWGNTASYSFTKEETSRKVGQTDRTGSTVNAGEFAVLDAGNIGSEIKEAKINKQKAENDLIEARRQIALEVKEAYYSYQEAIIQVKNSLEKVKFQEEAVKVSRSQAELNEALQSQLLEAMVKVTDERALYIKALSDYNLSLAKLNKAVGIKDYFKID